MLSDHAAGCDECRAAEVPVARIAALLDADVPRLDIGRLSLLAMTRVAPELEARDPALFWRRVTRALGLSLLPLPLVLAFDAVLLAAIYRAAAALLPSGVATYLVASYGLTVLIGIGLAYAAVPLLLSRRPDPPAAALEVNV
jgi:hypothetical protein